MSVATFEGIVENGQIRLKANVRLPDHIKVYVVVPEIQVEQVAHIFSPRLANPAQVVDFEMEIVEESPVETHGSSSQSPEGQRHPTRR